MTQNDDDNEPFMMMMKFIDEIITIQKQDLSQGHDSSSVSALPIT